MHTSQSVGAVNDTENDLYEELFSMKTKLNVQKAVFNFQLAALSGAKSEKVNFVVKTNLSAAPGRPYSHQT